MIGDLLLPPALPLLLGALFLAAETGRVRDSILVIAPLAALALVWLTPDGAWSLPGFMGYELVVVRGDRLSRWFGTVFAIMSFAGGLFALKQASRLEACASQLYAGAALGVVFAGDLVTTFIFWEIMALASTAVIWSAGPAARRAGMRYLLIHLLGGVLLMIGIAGEVQATGSTAFNVMAPDSPARWLILAGFLINAGAPPVSAWLPDAYPQSSYSGMVVLSAFTTKTAVFVLLRGFPGAEILIWVGLYMVFYGIVYAILENDMRRLLAYSIVNQVGFMVVAVGIGTEMALNGAASHAFAHIIYKALLLMSAGSVLYMTGKTKGTELGGLFRSMPITAVCGIVGALSISAFPLTSGFVTKSMIADAAGSQQLMLVWVLLVAAAAGVVLPDLKFPWFVFFQRDSGLRPADPPWNMRAAMIFFAVLCVCLGVVPDVLYRYLPFGGSYTPYTADHVVGQLQILLFAGLAFFLLLGFLQRTPTITLDTDWLWRRLGLAVWNAAAQGGRTFWEVTARGLRGFVDESLGGISGFARRGVLARPQPSGTMALLIVLLLAFYLLVEFAWR